MGYRLLASVVVVAHFAFLGYLVFGGFLAWRWPRTIWAHAATAAWGLAVVFLRLDCPLTSVQNWARRRAGQPALVGGFIDRYVEGVLYPQRYAQLAQIVAAVTVFASWIGFFWLRAGRPRAARGRLRAGRPRAARGRLRAGRPRPRPASSRSRSRTR